MNKNQKGFGHLELLIAVFVIGAVVAAGFIVYKRQHGDQATKTSNVTTEDKSSKKSEDKQQFNWSTQPSGPYQDKISYATSSDLLHWTDSGKIIAEHTSVPDAIVKDGVIYMYFVDVNTDGKHEQIGLKTSSDKGASWSATTIVTGLGDGAAVDPDPFLLPDGRIRLYYTVVVSRQPGDTSKHSIYSAVSTDGKTFTKEEGTRFTREQIVDPEVSRVGNMWRLYVGNGAKPEILSATSTDGLTFSYEGVAAQGGVPNVYYDGSRYLLFSAGVNISTSTDGKSFTALGPSQFKGVQGADPGVVKLGANNYLMVYKISGANQRHDPPVN